MIPNNISSINAAAAAANCMAEECNESSAATSSSPPNNWWPSDHHHHVHATSNSLSSWSNNNNNPWNPQNPNSNNSSGDEDVSMSTSFTNASNHSGLTVESSRNELIGETPSDNHLWNHVLLSVGNNGELQNNQDVGDNMINAFSVKNLSTGLFEPACDYLKKMDNGWEFTGSTSFNNFEKNFNGFSDTMFESERLTKLSNLVRNWSIAPPDPEINQQFDPLSGNISLSPTLDQYTPSDVCYMKPSGNRKLGSYSPHGHDLKVENEQREIEATGNLLRKSLNSNGIGYQMGTNNAMVGDNSKFYDGITDVPCNNGRNFADVMTFTNCLSKPWMNINASKLILKSLNLSDCKKQALQGSYTPTISTRNTVTRGNRRGQVLANEGKKKRSEENSSDTVLKKPKIHENSLVSSVKVQVPKAKLGDKITALQQIVSPFWKDGYRIRAWEAIGYIKFLQEQVQLLSNPYMKTNAIKDPWGGLDRKDRGELKLISRAEVFV